MDKINYLNRMKHLLSIVIFVNIAFSVLANNNSNELGIIKKNLIDITLNYTDYPASTIADFLPYFNLEKGFFNDLNYKDDTKSLWQPGLHWKRLTEMAVQYRTKTSLFYDDPALKEKIIKGIDYWLENHTRPKNAWWELIGVPNEMVRVFILLEDEIGADRIQRALPLINRAVLPNMYIFFGRKATGQNMLWETFIHINSSVLAGDTAGLHRAYNASADELIVTKLEGIQPDNSFHQHGAQSYAFGYGKVFSLSAAQILFSAKGTGYVLPQQKADLISSYLLDGQQWCSHGKMLEYTAMGREISRPENKIRGVIMAAQLMSKIDSKRINEFTDFIAQLKGEKRSKDLSGNKYFPYIDFMVQHGTGFMFTVKAASKDIVSTEMGNSENLKGYHLGHGTQFIVRRGDEYEGIFPVWDWERIPGSLCEQTGLKLPTYVWSKGAQGNSSFVLGASNSRNGCFTYSYDRDSVKAHRSWFCFDKEVVILVSGLHNRTENAVFQSVNQSFLHGEVLLNTKKMREESTSLENIQTVWHDSTTYIFPKCDYNILVSRKKQSGSWSEINEPRSTEKINKDVFSLSIDLGKSNQNTSFSYVIVPNTGVDDINSLKKMRNIKILENSGERQLVWDKDLDCLQAVIYKKGKINLPWRNARLEVDNPCVIVIQHVNNNLEIVCQFEKWTTKKLNINEMRNNCNIVISQYPETEN